MGGIWQDKEIIEEVVIKMKMIRFYCLSGKHIVVLSDPQIVTLKKGRSGVRMKAYTAFCPDHKKRMYRIIGKA